MKNKTIAAVATAHGIGSISIIRLSGDDALLIASKLTKNRNLKVRYATLTTLYDHTDSLIDEAIVIYFKAPHSFTAEDVIEFQCHGGMIVAQQVLKATLEAGAVLATPGEFSKRAFFNGRIDLSEAEAIASLIEAKSEDAAKILAKQMKGSLSEYVDNVRDRLLHILAYSEVTIDYAEEDLPEDLVLQMQAQLETIKKELSHTLISSESRAGLMQGFRVAIIGKPNVGKSSLLNMLLNYNRAIVSDIAGTTRDTIEEEVKIGSHLIRMVDTAGIRDSSDAIERIGVERSIEAIAESDIVIAIFDASRPCDSEDNKILELIEKNSDEKDFIVILNKSDLELQFETQYLENYDLIHMSCKEKSDQLFTILQSKMDSKNISDEVMLISSRQINAVKETMSAISEATPSLDDQELELFSYNIRDAVHSLGTITRVYDNEEMLDKMFGSFCLGK